VGNSYPEIVGFNVAIQLMSQRGIERHSLSTISSILISNYSQKGNSIERQVQKGKKGSCLFGHVTFFFISIELPFWFCHLLASCLSGKDSCLSGFLILPFWL
jgi:hypothetical protein